MVVHESQAIVPEQFDAVILDLDGVVTRTADLHTQAWKRLFDDYLAQRKARDESPFKPFDTGKDYRRYVEGRLRYEGVRSFLQSRGLHLDWGDPGDSPDSATICGLGNRKNELFQELLEKAKVEVHEDTLQSMRRWRKGGMKIGISSASRHCKTILDATGLSELIDAYVDGRVATEQGLRGKPAPDVFLHVAGELGVDPQRTAVVDDAIIGVQAGRRGHFGLVAGVARDGGADHLSRNGADVVVTQLTDLLAEPQKKPEERGAHKPWARDHVKQISRIMGDKQIALFLDYDGTLTPIVPQPEDAVLSDEMRTILKELSKLCTLAIVSGRDRQDVQNLVGLKELIYAGSHGFDITGPEGMEMQQADGRAALPDLDRAEQVLQEQIGGIEGVKIERKTFAIAVHYRHVAEPEVERIREAMERQRDQHPQLRMAGGKMIFELQPNVDWHKGRAVEYLLESLHLDKPEVLPIYIGDDTTDEDAFAALTDRGLSLRVGDPTEPTRAHYLLRDTQEVARFLQDLTEMFHRRETVDPWKLIYVGYDPKRERLREALCTLGNGWFATRGASEESCAGGSHYPGTYLAGGYNRLESEVAGRLIENEPLVNWPNWLCLSFRHEEGEWFDLSKVDLLEYHQELDLKEGILSRTLLFRDTQDRETLLQTRRIVHMGDPQLAAIEWVLTPLNWSGTIEIRSCLDGTVTNAGVQRYQSLNNQHLNCLESGLVGEDAIYLVVETNQSHIRMAQAAQTHVYLDGEPAPLERFTEQDQGWIAQTLRLQADRKRELRVEKIVTVATSREPAISESGHQARKLIQRVGRFAELLETHVRCWGYLWHRCDMVVASDTRTQLVLRLHIFHLLQTVSINSIHLDIGVPARGWHGEAYRGHIFWDELFIFPFLSLRIPELTRKLLMYRYRRLPEARYMARADGYRGAMFPWQSGSDGREESQVLHLNPKSGRWIPDNTYLQRHVNGAIAYNVWKYYQATEDVEFLSFFGAELILDIARFFSSIARFNSDHQRYEICNVVGPDEYHTNYPDSEEPGLKNNAYTNVLAVWVLNTARKVLDLLDEDQRQKIIDDLGIDHEELNRWQDITHKMFIPFHGDGIISQFEGYENLEEFDWKGYQQRYDNIHRLDRILEAEGDDVNRYQAGKQADVLMLFYLFSADELQEIFEQLGYGFDTDTIPKNIDYYFSRTSHGSTLSRIIHSWVFARSDRQRSYRDFKKALESDISDVQGGTTEEGIHLGAMAGTVDLVQRCYTGLEIRDDILWLNPQLPDRLPGVKLRVRYRGHWLSIELENHHCKVSFERGWSHEVHLGFQGEIYTFRQGETRTFEW